MGGTYSTVFYMDGALDAYVAQLLLKATPEFATANVQRFTRDMPESDVVKMSKGTSVFFLGVIPHAELLTQLAYYATSVTVISHRGASAVDAKSTVPKVQYLYYPDRSSLSVVWETRIVPYLKRKAAEDADKALVDAKTQKNKEEEEARKKKMEEERRGKLTAEQLQKEEDDKAAKAKVEEDKVAKEKAMEAERVAKLTVEQLKKEQDDAEKAARAKEEKSANQLKEEKQKAYDAQSLFTKLGLSDVSPAPWWLQRVDEFARGIYKQPWAAMNILKTAVEERAGENVIVSLLVKSEQELIDLAGHAQSSDKERVRRAVETAELKEWLLPDRVSRATATSISVVYADVQVGTDIQRIADQCLAKFENAKLFAGRIGNVCVVKKPAKTNIKSVRQLVGSLGQTENGTEDEAVVTIGADKYLP